MTSGRSAGILAALLLVAVPAAARAGEPVAPIDIVAALPPRAGAGAASAVLVGRAGQIYGAVAPGRWQRRIGGGVAVDLRAAVPASSTTDEVFAIGADSPPYHFQAGAWRAEPLGNRGPAALSMSGPLPALAIGRHIYTLDGAVWVRRASAAHRVTAAWAAAPGTIVLATAEGPVARWDGRRFATVRTPLPAADPIVELVGASPAALYGRARSGAWLRIDRASCARLTPVRELAGFEEHAAGPGPDGRLWLAGTLPGAGGARRTVLARADRDRLVLAAELPPLGAGDRVTVVLGHPPTAEVLVATRAGVVRIRDKRGTWTEGSASGALPAPPPRRGAPGAPARTR
ncbi:MAG TPA: hypothetical protein VK698_22045 [Kofleriaceae bacterium]|nr:hypothetical protein [Kofleriaceae bacterium]